MSSLSATGSLPGASTEARPRRGGLPTGRLIAFSTLAMPIAAAQVPLNVYLPAILAQHFGIALSTLGLVCLLAKVWGVVADPVIGILNDRSRGGRFGRRRSCIAVGGVLLTLAAILLFFPVIRVTPLYVAVALFAFYLAWSMIQIPYLAWSAEVSGDYDERTRVATYQTVTSAVSLLLVLVLPTIVDQIAPHDGRLKLGVMGGLILALLALSLPLTLKAFSERPPKAAGPRPKLGEVLRVIWGNPLLMRVLASDFAVALGQSIRGTLFVFVVTAYMGLPQWASGLFLAQFVFGLAAGPIWMRIAYRIGKHRAAVTGELAQVAINLGLLFVLPGNLPLLLGLTIAQGLAQGSGNLMLRAMVGDVADQDRLQTGRDRTALFFSVFSTSTKAAMAAAVGIALPLVAWLGFDPKAAANTPEALRGLLLVFALGPALAHLVSALLVVGFPLDARAHAAIRNQLADRDGAAAEAPAA